LRGTGGSNEAVNKNIKADESTGGINPPDPPS